MLPDHVATLRASDVPRLVKQLVTDFLRERERTPGLSLRAFLGSSSTLEAVRAFDGAL